MALTLLLTAALLLAALNVAAAAYVAGLSARRRAQPVRVPASALPLIPLVGEVVNGVSTDNGSRSKKRTKFVPPPQLPGKRPGALVPVAAAATRAHPSREGNSDSWICETGARIFAVLDGLGEEGGTASRKAAKSILRWIMVTRGKEGLSESGSEDAQRELHRLGLALDHAQAEVASLPRDEVHGRPGCAVVTALIASGQLLAGWCGDARAYRMRHGLLSKLKPDNTALEERLRSIGQVEGGADILSQTPVPLGSEGIVEPLTGKSGIEAGDRFLLCNAGLARALGERVIRGFLDRNMTPEEIAEKLVTKAANENPDDDMTAVVVEIDEIPAPAMLEG
jgi:serine/threonine protein phosphatase PrpC